VCCSMLVVVCSYSLDESTKFRSWMIEHGKVYSSHEEHIYRRSNFLQTEQMVKEHNNGNHSYTLGHNQFSDMTFGEFHQEKLMAEQHCSATSKRLPRLALENDTRYKLQLPASVDWRKKGIVSPVKKQGHCGSCWAFSTIAAMEAHMALAFNDHVILSEQQLLDCAQAFDNHGCNGGLPSHAFEYIHYNHGLMSEEDYPYLANQSAKCNFNLAKAEAWVGKIHNVTSKDEDELQEAVAEHGPVSIAYQVASDFKQYKEGVYDSTICKSGPEDVNHAVLAVGYGTDSTGKAYWIVKNSWGTDWGMDGYFNIARGKNMCGLADCASYPQVEDKDYVMIFD